ncbi:MULTISPECIES: D-aminoacyl-tRNA deacylase [Halobacterium]|uniref:D-aminoacyl-tRNA deacylase n=1 Tax=Halobacterium TaxID=2239 RepID=UPI00073E2CA9|nr:D-aminoacyl-tRNA deacylase [Halobacterium sp. CBA1132]MCG1002363.1 D-tyrosyl-tRNA(Tyr) deacylase [Halobacterium noricense]
MIGIVVSRADSASEHIGEHLLDLGDFEQTDAGVYRADGFELREFDDLHIDIEDPAAAFDDPDYVVVVSRHAGDTGALLTAHHTGNFGDAEYGGEDRALADACPNAHREVVDALREHAPDGYEVGMECTHHGPTEVSAPSMFVELGSDEEQWDDPEGARAVAQAVIDLRGVDARSDRALVAFGGGHYAPRPTRIVRETDWGVGHVAADWCLDGLGDPEAHREVVDRMFEASGAEHAVVDGDKPVVERVVSAAGHRVVSETWVRETDGVPLALVQSVEDHVRPVDDGLRFGERATDYDGDYTVVDLPADLLDAVHATDSEATVDAAAETALAYATEENGNRLAGPVAFEDAEAYDAFLERAAEILERDYNVAREDDTLSATRDTFDPAAASDLGVPEGPKFGRLAAGEPVDVDGAEIRPSEVTRTETTSVSVGLRERTRERVRRASDTEGKGN